MIKKTMNGLIVTTLIVGATQAMESPTSFHSTHKQIIGTQAIGGAYQFTKDDKIVEQAKRIHEMGSNMIKIRIDTYDSKNISNNKDLNDILKMPFDTYFFWWRSGSKKEFLDEKDLNTEYTNTYNFTKELLTKYAYVEKTFYLGHWEGDWYIIPKKPKDPNNPEKDPGYDTEKHAIPSKIEGMIKWLNIRQKAVDCARNEMKGKSLSKVFHYTEVNRVKDALVHKRDRMVNKVLPSVNVDYVSYSAYDVQKDKLDVIKKTIKYIEDNLGKRAEISGDRVFIGECGLEAIHAQFNPEKHEKMNREIMIKFLECGVPYILYWQMYNNEVKDNVQQGFWLINDKNEKQPLYFTLENLYKAQKGFKDIRNNSIDWLNNPESTNSNSKEKNNTANVNKIVGVMTDNGFSKSLSFDDAKVFIKFFVPNPTESEMLLAWKNHTK